MASIAQVVRQITETLSDAVSQLVLYVIVLQEQNADCPENLRPAAHGVGGAAEKLEQVAIAVAAQGYTSYPDIQKKITTAAANVGSAKSELLGAVDVLAAAGGAAEQRRAAWEQMISACRVIAGTTVLLLQIVYGAEVERLFRSVETTSEALQGVNPRDAGRDPQSFADSASAVASQAKQVAVYLRHKADATESPLLKESLSHAAAQLDDIADRLIDDVNELLGDLNDSAKQNAVDQRIAELAQVLDEAKRLLADAERDTPGVDARFLDRSHDGSKLGDAARNFADPATLAAAQRLRDANDTLTKASTRDHVESPAVNRAIEDAEAAHKDFAAAAMQEAARRAVDEPTRKRQIVGALEELAALVPAQVELARDAGSGNTDPVHKNQMNKLFEEIDDAISDVAGDNARLAQAVISTERALGRVLASARSPDGDKVGQMAAAARGAVDANSALVAASRTVASNLDGERPLRAQQLRALADRLEKALPNHLASAKLVQNNPQDPAAKEKLGGWDDEIHSALDEVNPANARGTADRALREVDRLTVAASQGQKQETDSASRELPLVANELAKLTRQDATRMKDQDRAAALRNAADRLTDLFVPALVDSAKNSASTPDPTMRAAIVASGLGQLRDATKQTIHEIAGGTAAAQSFADRLDDVFTAVAHKNGQIVDAALSDMSEAARAVTRAARRRAAATDTSKPRSKQILDDISELEALIPAIVSAARALADTSAGAADRSSAQDKLGQLVDTAARLGFSAADPDAARDRDANTVKQQLECAVVLANAGDRAGAHNAAEQAACAASRIVKHAFSLADESTDPTRAGALRQVADALGVALSPDGNPFHAAVDASALNPRDGAASRNLVSAHCHALNALDAILSTVASSSNSEPVLSDAIGSVRQDLKALNDAVRANDSASVCAAADRLTKSSSSVAPLTSALRNAAIVAGAVASSGDLDARHRQQDLLSLADAISNIGARVADSGAAAAEGGPTRPFEDGHDSLQRILCDAEVAASQLRAAGVRAADALLRLRGGVLASDVAAAKTAANDFARAAAAMQAAGATVSDDSRKEAGLDSSRASQLDRDLNALSKLVNQQVERALNPTAWHSVQPDTDLSQALVRQIVNPEDALAVAARSEVDALDVLQSQVRASDSAKTRRATERLSALNTTVASLAKSVAERAGGTSSRAAKLRSASDQLETDGLEVVKHSIAASEGTASTQVADDATNQLRTALGNILDEDSSTLALVLAQARDVLAHASACDTDKSALRQAIQNRNEKLLPTVRSDASRAGQAKNKSRQQILNKACDTVERQLPRSLDGDNYAIDAVLRSLADIAAPDAIMTVHDISGHLSSLERAVSANEPQQVASSGTDLLRTGEQLHRELDIVADELDRSANSGTPNMLGVTPHAARARARVLRAAASVVERSLQAVVVKAAERLRDGKNADARQGHDAALASARAVLAGINESLRAPPRTLGLAFAEDSLNRASKPFAIGSSPTESDRTALLQAVASAIGAAKTTTSQSSGSDADRGVPAASAADRLVAVLLEEQHVASSVVNAAAAADASSLSRHARSLVSTHSALVPTFDAARRGESSVFESMLHPAVRQSEFVQAADSLNAAVPDLIRASKQILVAGGTTNADAADISSQARAEMRLHDAAKDAISALQASAEENMIVLAEALQSSGTIEPAKLKRDAAALASHAVSDARQYAGEGAADRIKAVAVAARDLVLAANSATSPNAGATEQIRLGEAAERVLAATEARVVAAALQAAQRARGVGAAARHGVDFDDFADTSTRVAGGVRQLVEQAKQVSELAQAFARRSADRDRMLERVRQLDTGSVPSTVASARGLLTASADDIKSDYSLPQQLVAKSALDVEADALGVVHAAKPTPTNDVLYQAKLIEAAARGTSNASTIGEAVAVAGHKADIDRAITALTLVATARDSNPVLHDSNLLLPAARKVASHATALEVSAADAAAQPSDAYKAAYVAARHRDLLVALEELRSKAQVGAAVVDALSAQPAIDRAAARLKNLLDAGDLGNLFDAARELADLLGNLLGSANSAARDLRGSDGSVLLTDAARDALDLLDLIASLEGSAVARPPDVSAADISKAFESLDRSAADQKIREQEQLAAAARNDAQAEAAANAAAASTSPDAVPETIPEKESFEDNLEAVAQHVRQTASAAAIQLDGDDPILKWINAIAVELAKVADAARSGNRQEFLIGGRTVSAHIKQLEKAIREFSASLQRPDVKERLIRTTEVLGNHSTQMKILAAVRAAGGGKDSSDQLVSVSRALGYACSDTVSTVIEARLRQRGASHRR